MLLSQSLVEIYLEKICEEIFSYIAMMPDLDSTSNKLTYYILEYGDLNFRL